MPYLFDARVIQNHFPGIGRVAYNLLAHLPAMLDEHEQILALRNPFTQNTRYDLNALAHPKLQWVDVDTPVFSPRNLLSSARSLMGVNVSPEMSHFNYYLRPLRAPRPSITSIYDAISFVYPQYVPSFKTRLVIMLAHRLAITASDAIITISTSAANDLKRIFPAIKHRTFVTPLAADATMRPQPDAEIDRVRAKFNLPNTFALYLASNKPHKNLEHLVEAWHLLNTQHSTLSTQHLVIAGHQDPRFPQAQQLAEKLGIAQYVKFIGEVPSDDMATLYTACTLFVFPSLYEGFGLTPLEAMACGAAVACSNASSLPEVMGDAAILFDPNDPQAIANACRRVLADETLRQTLKSAGLARAKQFTWQNTASETLKVYRQLLNG